MKKIVFSLIILFGASLFIPNSSFAQLVVKSRKNKRSAKVIAKKPNRNKGVTVKTRTIQPHRSRVVIAKPNRPKVIIKRPNRIRKNHIWVGGHWMWSDFYREYIWIKGKWMRKRRGYHWVSGSWEVRLGGFIWVEGYWAR